MESAFKPAAGADPPRFVGAMHGVRGLSILLVVAFHLALNSRWLPNHDVPASLVSSGFLAVDVLFFTTGFVLFLPVVLKGGLGDLRAFGIRRFARIAPAYWVCLLVILLAYPLLAGDVVTAGDRRGVADYLVHFAFLQREVLPSDVGLGVNGPLWTLSIDVLFYFLLPLIAVAYRRHPLVGLGIGLGISLVWRIALVDSIDATALSASSLNLPIQFPLFAGDFAAGMTAAWLFVELGRSERRWLTPGAAAAVAAAAFAGLVALAYGAGANLPFFPSVFLEPTAIALAFPLALGVFVAAITRAPRWAQWPLTNRLTFWFSEISYSVYIYHSLAIVFAFETLGMTTNRDLRSVLTLAAVVLPITIAVAALSYLFVEVPGRRYGRELARRASSARRSKWTSSRRSSPEMPS